MADLRVNRLYPLEKQFASLMDMFEGLTKKMEENNAKLHSLLLKKLDMNKNEVQCPKHLENLIAQNILHHCVVKATPALASKSE
jgi:hypothetical protein